MKQKLLSLFVALLMGAGMYVTADPYDSGTCGANGDNLTWELNQIKDRDYELTIRGTGAMEDYWLDTTPPEEFGLPEEDNSRLAPWNQYGSSFHQHITSVVIESGVTSIGDYAFYGCSYMTSISIPEGVTRIGGSAFSVAQNLESISLPSTLEEIGNAAFATCKKLTSLSIPASVKKIEGSIIGGAPITSLSVEEGNTVYDSRNDCNAVIETETNTLVLGCETSVIPNGITAIGASAFYYCQFTSITIPSSVQTLGRSAFGLCTQLESITSKAVIPPVVEKYVDAFSGTSKDIPVYVYAESIEAYQAAENWKDFTNYQALKDDRKDPNIRFTETEIEVEAGKDVYLSELLQSDAILDTRIWSSADESIATVNEYGTVHAVSEGETTITVNFPGNEEYKKGSANITVKVISETYFTFCGVKVNSANCKNIFSDGKAAYDNETKTLTISNMVVDAKGQSYTDMRSAVINFDQDEPLTIIVNGHCEFTNIGNGIIANEGANIIGGELVLSGSYQAFGGFYLSVDGCNLTAIGAYESVPAIVASDYLEVKNNAHIFAKNTQEIDYPDGDYGYPAIATLNPQFDDNIAILTPGVHFFLNLAPIQWQGSFFTDEENTVYASEIEIGKGAVVVSDIEQTTINFSEEGAEDAVVFSSSANDRINTETGQIEISSTISDDDVADALESLVPGSAEWIEKLPGSITLSIPQGKGTLKVKCKTSTGFTLKIKMEGIAAISINQSTLEWFSVNYDVLVPTTVVIYLNGSGSPAPARIATSAKDEEAGAYIEAIEITPDKTPTSIESLIESSNDRAQKVLMNGTMYIIRDNNVYTVTGTTVR